MSQPAPTKPPRGKPAHFDERARQFENDATFQAFAAAYGRVARRCRLSGEREVLDVGCGSGALGRGLGDRAAGITGVDLSTTALQLARNRSPALRVVRADMHCLPFVSHKFDLVTAFSSVEFCRDRPSALRELCRMLRPGGRAYIEVRNADFLCLHVPRILKRLLVRVGLIVPHPAADFEDLDYGEWRRLLTESNLVIEGSYAALRPWNYGPPLMRLKNLIIAVVRGVAPLRYHYMCGFVCAKGPARG